MKMKHYAMMNHYASPSSDGFSNTWYAVAFGSRVERDTAISEGINAARLALPSERKECEAVREIYTLADFAQATRRL
jgi:hypothetical protein